MGLRKRRFLFDTSALSDIFKSDLVGMEYMVVMRFVVRLNLLGLAWCGLANRRLSSPKDET